MVESELPDTAASPEEGGGPPEGPAGLPAGTVASRLGVSTTMLRRYEAQGLIPQVPRTTSGHRRYGEVHIQGFRTIRALLRGFDIPLVYEAMRSTGAGDFRKALWLLNRELHVLHLEKERVEQTLAMVRAAELGGGPAADLPERASIGKAAELAGVNASAIRHWEAEGLIVPGRDEGNGYRIYRKAELRKILIVSSLRRTAFFLAAIKKLLDDLDSGDTEAVLASFARAREGLDLQLARRYAGIAEWMAYLRFFTEPAGGEWPAVHQAAADRQDTETKERWQ